MICPTTVIILTGHKKLTHQVCELLHKFKKKFYLMMFGSVPVKRASNPNKTKLQFE